MSDQMQLQGGFAPSKGGTPLRPANPVLSLLDDFSLEMSGKDQPALREAQDVIPDGTLVNVTFLSNESLDLRVNAAQTVRESGFLPVPHIAARRLQSEAQLREFLERLREAGANERVFAVGGDPRSPEGPYQDSLALIRSGLLADYGVGHVSIAGYPDGHPDIEDDRLWAALMAKYAALTQQGLNVTILTQFGFDVEPVLRWIAKVREMGIDARIRVGVPGPAGVKRLLAFAARFGVASSASVVKKYGLSLTNLFGTAGPDRFINSLAEQLDGKGLGKVSLHFYAFGGLQPTGEWIRDFRKEA
ncbi:methylenetetrahydrofolate reductase [Burkholderia sp. BCC1977]|uniref:methylenetetrahydrofolate reductase n=1 Tax=Burkholderia sp. BCC1977 TaxID=2817440 RepID=UPI002ABE58D3|nr:methylenetetrahydrofolate reductase [Burkholderia sp. BCC1977]